MKKILMISLSRHACFQDGIFSMYHLLKEKYTVYTITKKNDDYPAPHEQNNFFVNAPGNPGFSIETLNLIEWFRLIKLIVKLKPDYIYLESFHIWNYPIMLYSKLKRAVLSISLHDITLHPGDSHLFIKRILNTSQVKFADRIVMRSQNGLKNAEKLYPKDKTRMFRADLWYAFPDFCPPRGNIVLFFGRMNRYKGIDNLYELIKSTPELNYVVAGKADDADIELVEQIGFLPNARLENRVVPYNEMHDYFYNARCIVLPYKSATQSGVILDATKHSRPAVAFSVGALGEQIIDGKTGLLAEPGNIQDLSKKVREIMNMNDKDYETMCRNAYEFGLKNYSPLGQEEVFLKAIGVKK